MDWLVNWLQLFMARMLPMPAKDMRMKWKIVRIDEAAWPEALEKEHRFGVIVSSYSMLAKTQSLLFCPLINASAGQNDLTEQAWHVKVKPESSWPSDFPYQNAFMSTKLVLPASLNDLDGMERGRICPTSRLKASMKLKEWLGL